MESLKQNKILLILFTLSLIAFLTYEFGGTFRTPQSLVAVSTEQDRAATEILTSLQRMQQARIDTELLSSTAWKSLVDYSVQLPTDAPGRTDLFSDIVSSPTPVVSVDVSTTTKKR